MSHNKSHSGGASLSNHLQGNLPSPSESQTWGVSEPAASAGLPPEGPYQIVSQQSGKKISFIYNLNLAGGAFAASNQHQTGSYLSRIKKALANVGLPYVILRTTPGDGNCFFHSVMDQMNRSEIKQGLPKHAQNIQDHMALRQAVVQVMAQDKKFQAIESAQFQRNDLLAQLAKPGESKQNAWQCYLQEMSKNGYWAETLVIMATAVFLQTDIFLTSEQQTKKFPWNEISSFCEQKGSPITIAYIPGQHFQSIHPDPTIPRCYHCCAEFRSSPLEHLEKSIVCQRHYEIRTLKSSQTRPLCQKPDLRCDQLTAKIGLINIIPGFEICKNCKREFKSLNIFLVLKNVKNLMT